MIQRNHALLCIFFILLILSISCQGGGNPTAPDASDDGTLEVTTGPAVRDNALIENGHQLLALLEISIDAETSELNVSYLRTASHHLDLIQLIPLYCSPPSDCLDFINLEINEETAVCDLDVVVTHPVPDSYADVFDMRGIGIFKGTLDAGFPDGTIATQMLNADGFTTHYDVGGEYDAFLNPYIAFNKSYPNRIFENSTTSMVHVTCQFPSLLPEDARFLYALDATWSDPLFYDPEDPLTDPNIAEPYQVNIIHVDPIANEYLAQGTAIVEVFDWQANAGDTEIECPALFGGSYIMSEVWSDNGRYIFMYNLFNDEEPTPGWYPVLAKANDIFDTQPDLIDPGMDMQLDNYQLGSVLVYNSESNTAPVASVVADELIIQPGGFVHFDASGSSDAEDGTVALYAWDLDGDCAFNNGTASEVDYQYNDVGIYPVNVLVEDSMSLTDVLDLPIIVYVNPGSNTPPVAMAFASNTTPNISQEITLDASNSYDLEDGTPISWEWDLDNDSVYDDADGEVIQYSWDTAGTYFVDVLVKDSGGLGDALDETIEIEVIDSGNLPPTAVAVADKYTAAVGEEIIFDGSGSSDPEEGGVSQWMWDLTGDGNYNDGYSEIEPYVYFDPGTYLVDLKVYDSMGLFDTLDEKLTIEITGETNHPPVAIAFSDKYIVGVDEVFNLDATDSYDPEEGDVAMFSWDLNGDGMFIDAFTPTVEWWFSMPGEYFIDVMVCDTPGLCDTLDEIILIQVLEGMNQPPVAVATADQYFIFDGETVNFDGSDSYDNEDGAPVSWQWDLDDDGDYDDSPFILASWQFFNLGEHIVDLKVTDSDGLWDTLDEPIIITVLPSGSNVPPIAIGSVNCVFPAIGQPLLFTNESLDIDGTIVSWEWNFDDGNGWVDFTGTEGETTYAFTEEGVYFVDHRVTDDLDASDTLDTMLSIFVAIPDFTPPDGPPLCEISSCHMPMLGSSLSIINTNPDVRDLAFLNDQAYLTVINDGLYIVGVPSMVIEPPMLTNAGGIRSIDTTSTGLVALSELDDNTVQLFSVIGSGEELILQPVKNIDVGQPLSAVAFDDFGDIWVYTQGEVRGYRNPAYDYDPCRVFIVPEIELLGTVDEMEFNPWNHSVYLVINDGAGGTIAEVDHLGNVGTVISGIFPGPSRYLDIIIDKNTSDPAASGCRIEVFGGINTGYIARFDADLNIINQSTFGYWGIRAAAIMNDKENLVIALEDCCVSWVDLMDPPPDWNDMGD